MNKYQTKFLFLLRISLGWLFLYAGISHLLDPAWSAGGYLGTAKTFPALYQWLASSSVLPVVNILNEWGLTLIGLALILGIFVRISSMLGALMMFLYYLVVLDFPNVGAHGFIVDEHVIYIFVFLLLAVSPSPSHPLGKWYYRGRS